MGRSRGSGLPQSGAPTAPSDGSLPSKGTPNTKPTSPEPIPTLVSEPIVYEEAEVIRNYLGPLGELEKNSTRLLQIDPQTLSIKFLGSPTGTEIQIRCQDIFVSGAQVIVNAANTHLGIIGNGGVNGAILDRGGKPYKDAHLRLQTFYQSKSGFKSGYAAMIESGDLKQAPYNIENVIVVAGPQKPAPLTGAPGELKEMEEKYKALYSCYYNALITAEKAGKKSIAFSSISTGIYRFPKDRAAEISLRAIYDFLHQENPQTLKTISIHYAEDQAADLTYYETAVSH